MASASTPWPLMAAQVLLLALLLAAPPALALNPLVNPMQLLGTGSWAARKPSQEAVPPQKEAAAEAPAEVFQLMDDSTSLLDTGSLVRKPPQEAAPAQKEEAVSAEPPAEAFPLDGAAGLLGTGSRVRQPPQEAAPPPADVFKIMDVPLRKQYVPVFRNDNVVAYKTAYFGPVSVGGPDRQTFTVVFDTGSGHFILPSTACFSETCTGHRRYNRAESLLALDIEYDGTLILPDAVERDQVAIAFGTGEVLGEFVQEKVCLGESSDECVQLRIVLATEMTSDPFGLFAFDGVLGLGLDALTLNPQFNFFGQMSHQTRMPAQFSVFLARSDEGESVISFGGHDPARAQSALSWAPVAMEELGYWQVQLKSVMIGDTPLEECADGTCRAILDTGTSLLGVPRQASRAMHRLLARPAPEGPGVDADKIDCREVPGQELRFDLGDAVVTLGVEDYSRPTPFNMSIPGKEGASKPFCRSLLLPVDMKAPLGPKIFIWGEPVLRRYYTVYDLEKRRVGFALASQPEPGANGVPCGLPPVGSPPSGTLISGAPLPPKRLNGGASACPK